MDSLAEAVNDMHITDLSAKKNRIQNRIQVSNTKKPLFFYVNLAKVPLPFLLHFCFWDFSHRALLVFYCTHMDLQSTYMQYLLVSFTHGLQFCLCRSTCSWTMRWSFPVLEWVLLFFLYPNFCSIRWFIVLGCISLLFLLVDLMLNRNCFVFIESLMTFSVMELGDFLYEYWRNHNLFCFVSAAIATVVTIAEILKNNGLAVEKSTVPYAFLISLFRFWCMLMLFWLAVVCNICRDHH